jgi:hypothetical protein
MLAFMRGIRPSSVLAAAVVAGAVLCACGGRGGQQAATPAPQARGNLENPSTFPLYPRSRVTVVVPVSSKQIFAAIKASDPKASLPPNFRGHEVIAETNASLRQLETWVIGLEKTPPRGLIPAERALDTPDPTLTGRNSSGGLSTDFDSTDGSRRVFLIAVDPKRVREQLGPVFTLIENYSAVPGAMRGSIDEQAKQQFGYSVTEMLDEKSPVGAAVAELKRLSEADRRAIVLLDLAQIR